MSCRPFLRVLAISIGIVAVPNLLWWFVTGRDPGAIIASAIFISMNYLVINTIRLEVDRRIRNEQERHHHLCRH